tara:strand:+ start:769 stop:1032 length:264 start_codon:yes stop_codon:yes gene_type:complete
LLGFKIQKSESTMTRESQRKIMQSQRMQLIQELEETYLNAFTRMANVEMKEGDIAKLTQIFLESKDNAIKALKAEVEKPRITKAPKD